jgi:hypothetical protein
MADEQIKFEFTAINKTAAAFNSINTSLSKMSSEVLSVRGGMTALIATITSGALLNMGRQALDAAGGLGELASQTGASTKALQAYKFIALENGVTNEQMQKGFAQLTKRLGEAKLGSDKMIEAFGAVGVSGRDLASLTTDQAMLKIADAMSKIEDPAKRAALETQLFGKAGQALDPILRLGSAAIQEQTQKLAEMGLVMDEATIKKADEAADKIATLTEVLRTRFTIAVAENADAILALANAFGTAAAAAGNFLRAINQTARNTAIEAANPANTSSYFGGLVNFRTGKRRTKGGRGGGSFDPTGEFNRSPFTPLAPPMSALDVPKILSSGGGAGRSKSAAAQKKTSILTPENYSSWDAYRQAIRQQLEADLPISNFKNMAETPLIEILPNADQLSESLNAIKGPMRMITSEASELADSIGASFGNAFQGLITATQGFKSAFRSMASSIISELMRIYVTEQLVKSIGGFFKSVFAGPLPGRAIGGSVQSGQPYMVGERGPEMFVPSRSGSIVPNGKMGGGINISVDARGASDPAAVRQQVELGIAQAAPYIIAAAQNRTLKTAGRTRLPGTIG